MRKSRFYQEYLNEYYLAQRLRHVARLAQTFCTEEADRYEESGTDVPKELIALLYQLDIALGDDDAEEESHPYGINDR